MAGNPGSGSDGGTGQGSPGKGSNADGSQAGNPQSLQQGSPARAESSSDDSSSPLIPILIAVALLAAISVGAVLYRQRRQRPGTSVSPKAS